jgi:hypothetical protein
MGTRRRKKEAEAATDRDRVPSVFFYVPPLRIGQWSPHASGAALQPGGGRKRRRHVSVSARLFLLVGQWRTAGGAVRSAARGGAGPDEDSTRRRRRARARYRVQVVRPLGLTTRGCRVGVYAALACRSRRMYFLPAGFDVDGGAVDNPPGPTALLLLSCVLVERYRVGTFAISQSHRLFCIVLAV